MHFLPLNDSFYIVVNFDLAHQVTALLNCYYSLNFTGSDILYQYRLSLEHVNTTALFNTSQYYQYSKYIQGEYK